MSPDALLWLAAASITGGIAVLRLAWSRDQRSLGWNASGWSLLLLSMLLAGAGAGAWGMAVVGLWGMAAAMAVLGYAAWCSPATSGARASNRRVGMLPQGNEPRHLGRRAMTFLLTGLAAMLVSVGLAILSRSMMTFVGASEADAIVAALFTVPLAWALLVYALLMTSSRARQGRLLIIWGAAGALAIMTGMIA